MAKKGNDQHHLVPHPEGWAVERSNGEKPSRVLPTKREGEKVGREISRNQGTEFIVHRQDGTFERSDSHGKDPHPPKG